MSKTMAPPLPLVLLLVAISASTASALLHPCPSDKNATDSSNAPGIRCFYVEPMPPVPPNPYAPQYPQASPYPDPYYGTNPNRMGAVNYPDIYGYRTHPHHHHQQQQYPQQYPQQHPQQQPYGDYRGTWPSQAAPPAAPPAQPHMGWWYPNHDLYRQQGAPGGGGGYGYPPGYATPGTYPGIYGPPISSMAGPGGQWNYYNRNDYPYQRRSTYTPPPKAEEPLYLGHGSVRSVGERDVELACSFHDPTAKVVSNAAWVKVTGPYDVYQARPPFDCMAPGCNYVHLNAAQDFRYRVISLGQSSHLRIYDANPMDYGVYRCATTAIDSGGKSRTLYQVVVFAPPPSPQRPYAKK